MPDAMSPDPEVVAVSNAMRNGLHLTDYDDPTPDEAAGPFLAALHAAGYRVVAAESETETLAKAATVVLSDLLAILDNPPHHPVYGIREDIAKLEALLDARTHRGGTPA